MLWRVTLAVAVVCVGGICSCVKADVMGRLIMPRDYGVKLCGREFIRAVIFTCGGSRWRRSIEGDLDPSQWSSLSVVTENNQHIWRRGTQLTDTHSPLHVAPSYSLSDLLSVYGTVGDRQQQQPSLSVPDMMGESQPSTDLGAQEQNPGDWPVTSKKKRNFSLGVAGMCCTQGCTKNDIGRLC